MNHLEIKKFREENDLTQAQLAEITGVSIRAVQSWEQNQRNITQSAIKLIEAYKLTNEKLMLESEHQKELIQDQEKILIDKEAWDIIKLQAESLAKRDEQLDKRDSQIDELISILKEQKGGAADANNAAPKEEHG